MIKISNFKVRLTRAPKLFREHSKTNETGARWSDLSNVEKAGYWKAAFELNRKKSERVTPFSVWRFMTDESDKQEFETNRSKYEKLATRFRESLRTPLEQFAAERGVSTSKASKEWDALPKQTRARYRRRDPLAIAFFARQPAAQLAKESSAQVAAFLASARDEGRQLQRRSRSIDVLGAAAAGEQTARARYEKARLALGKARERHQKRRKMPLKASHSKPIPLREAMRIPAASSAPTDEQ